jgi:hypothetical protein
VIAARSLAGLVVALLLLLAGAAAAPTGAATTASTTLAATDDGYVDASRPRRTFGSADMLRVGRRPVLRSYLRFDLSSLEGAVTRAVLQLTATSASRAGLDVREVADSSWRESTLRYANAPRFSGPIGVRAGALTPGKVVSLDVTASVQAGIGSFALVDRRGAAPLSLASSESRRPNSRPRLVVTTAPAGSPETPCGSVEAPPRRVDHVIWIWMENKPYDAIIGKPSAQFVNELAAQCGLATNYHAVAHPSLPNYIAATSGSTQGIEETLDPAALALDVPSIYSQVRAVGKTWRDYAESAPGNCPTTSSGRYAVRHDPAPYYRGIRSDCLAWDVPMGTTEGGNFLGDLTNDTLPAFSFVTPDLCHGTHDCPVATGDAWLRSWFAKILASPAYASGRTVVFLTWDEDDGSAGNHVPMLVVSPSTPAGARSGTRFDHYSLLKTTEQLLGITTFLGNAGNAGTASMVPAFNLG